jgi:hypothetical protein
VIQKLMQQLAKVRQAQLEQNSTPIGSPDISYEAGRRVGVIQGMSQYQTAINTFIADTDEKDKEL